MNASTVRERRGTGSALISVLLVLTAVILLAVTGLYLTNTNLAIAGNIVGNTIAKSNAESGIDATIAMLYANFESTGNLPGSIQAPAVNLSTADVDYGLESVVPHGNRVHLKVIGYGPNNAEYLSEALVEFKGTNVRGPIPFGGGVVACEGLDLLGGGMIDGFDSRVGPYDQRHRLRSAQIRTTMPNAHIHLDGGTNVYGDIFSTGGVTIDAGASVYGDIVASDDVLISSAGTFDGEIHTTGNLSFSNTASVSGNVSSNGELRFDNVATVEGNAASGADMVFTNNGRIEGNAHVGGEYLPVRADYKHVQGTVRENAGSVSNQPVAPEVCDPIDIETQILALQDQLRATDKPNIVVGNYPKVNWRISPSTLTSFDDTWNVKEWVQEAGASTIHLGGSEIPVLQTGDFHLANGEIRVREGHVVLFIDGNFETSGGGKMVIERGSSLTLYITGKTRLGSSFRIVDEYGFPVSATLADTQKPTFSIYSAHTGQMARWNERQTAGVVLEGSTDVPVNVYAPNTGIYVSAGGDIYGALRGKEVAVVGGAGIHYDVALGEIEHGSPNEQQINFEFEIISRR